MTNNLQAYPIKLESQSKTFQVFQLHPCYMAPSLLQFSCNLLYIHQFSKSVFYIFLLFILQYCMPFSLFSSHSFSTALSSFQLLESLFINFKRAQGAHKSNFLNPSFSCKLALQTFIHSFTHSTTSLVS